MPGGDGTGPLGRGPGTGRGQGRGMGRGMGRGIGRMGGTRAGAGSGGYCVCPNCGKKVAHQVGIPCYSIKCPDCGVGMARE